MAFKVLCISTALFLYNLVLYPILLFLISLFFKDKTLPKLDNYPTVTVLCPAYNEEKVIEEKLISFVNLNYPKDKIKMIVISDDSTDKTNEIVEEYCKKHKNIELIVQKPRKGKVSGMNMIQPMIKSDYVLSTDATSIFDKNAVVNLVKKMLTDKRIGFVGGDMRFQQKKKTSGEDTYFSVENKIKYWESKIYSTVTSNGVLYLIKREFFKKVDPASPDDFERLLYTIKKGYLAKFIYDAFVYEEVEDKAVKEFKRKTRIISTSWAAVFRQIQVLNPFKHLIPAIFLFSHKILRWLIGILSITIFVSSALLIKKPFFKYFFIFELIVLLSGIFELILQSKNKSCKLTKFSGYFITMNLASLVGLYKFLTKNYSGVWNTERK